MRKLAATADLDEPAAGGLLESCMGCGHVGVPAIQHLRFPVYICQGCRDAIERAKPCHTEGGESA